MKTVTIIFIFFSSLIFSQNIYFSTPTAGSNIPSGQVGYAAINYNFFHSNSIVVHAYYAKLTYPDGSTSAWMEGEIGGWNVTKAGTYWIQGQAWVTLVWGGSSYWTYRDKFSFSVVDNEPPSAPQNLSVSPNGSQDAVLTWSSNSENDLSFYKIYRKDVTRSYFYQIATTSSNSYTDEEIMLAAGGFDISYKIVAVDVNTNVSDFSNTVYTEGIFNKQNANDEENESLPNDFSLDQNYPNPFNPTTKISYQLPKASNVTLKVYDMLGKEVAELVNENESAGIYTISFDANNLPSGLYFYKIQAGEFTETRKMLLMK